MPVELRERLFSPCGEYIERSETVAVDIGALVRRLILFDRYVLESTRLKEFPELVRAVGVDGVMNLLEDGCLWLTCDAVAIGSPDEAPSGSLAVKLVKIADRRSYVSDCLRLEIDSLEGVSQRQKIRLKSKVADRLLTPPDEFGMDALRQFQHDAISDPTLVRQAMHHAVVRELGSGISGVRVEMREAENERVGYETNLPELAGVTPEQERRVVREAMFSIATMNLRLEYMAQHRALTGFKENEMPLFDSKLAFIVQPDDPDAIQCQFDRVVSLGGLPDFEHGDPVELDVARLLEIRRSGECRAFRAWLRTASEVSDEEIAEALTPVLDRLRLAYRGRWGKTARLTVTTGAGMGPGSALAGAAGTLIDAALGRVLGEPGPTAFISRLYPSIFKT